MWMGGEEWQPGEAAEWKYSGMGSADFTREFNVALGGRVLKFGPAQVVQVCSMTLIP